MSTRSRIACEIPSEFLGKEIKLSLSGLWCGIEDQGLKDKVATYTIPDNTKYISCYVHFDGYPDGVGNVFSKYTLASAFETIKWGDRSELSEDEFLDEPESCYINREGEDTVRCFPKFHETLEDYLKYLDGVDYLYLMDASGKVHIYG